MIVSGAQIRAARALLNLTQMELARASGLHPNAIAYWEERHDIPVGLWREPYACRRIRGALKTAGVQFLTLPVIGVRLSATHNKRTSTRGRARAHHGVLDLLQVHEIEAACNTPVDPSPQRPPRCDARTRADRACLRKAMPNGRCRNHGGLSTGPKSDAGRNRIAEAQKRRWARWRNRQALLAPNDGSG